jgi:hypothetical protein
LSSTLDPARIAANEPIVYSGVHDGFEQPVCLGNARRVDAGIKRRLPPLADVRFLDLSNGTAAEGGIEMAAQYVAIHLGGTRPEVAFVNPGCRVICEWDQARVRVEPVATQDVRFGEAPAPAEVAERLGVEPGAPVWARQRTTLINGRPNQLADSYYDLSVTKATPKLTEEHTGPGGGFARLEEAGYRLTRIREELAARMPVGPEIVALDLPDGTPVIELIRTTYDSKDKPIEVMVSIIAGDMVTFCYDFPHPGLRPCRSHMQQPARLATTTRTTYAPARTGPSSWTARPPPQK